MVSLLHLITLIAIGLVLFVGDQSQCYAQSLEHLKAGVVKITATVDGQVRIGTGFIIKIEDGTAYIVTASHVVEGATLTLNFFPKPDVKFSGVVKEMDGGNPKGLAVVLVKES